MDEKIKKLSRKVEGLISVSDSAQSVYDQLTYVAKNQRDYFIHLGPDNLIKLSIYIYSLKETNDFKLGEKIINNLSFIELVSSEGNPYFEECPDCGGDGTIRCDSCDGLGLIDCEECEGSGEIDGEACQTCDGDGEVTCGYCGGDGDETCQTCDGNGDLESDDEIFYNVHTIVTWSKKIQESCELRENTGEPAMSESEFDSLRDQYIILNLSDDEHGPLDIQIGEMYCVAMESEPQLKFMGGMRIEWHHKYNEIAHLYR